MYLSKENERSITKLETKLEREKTRRHAATTEEAVAVGLLLTAQQQLHAAEAQEQVCKRVGIGLGLGSFVYLCVCFMLCADH